MKQIDLHAVLAQGLFWAWFFCLRYTEALRFTFAECLFMTTLSFTVALGMTFRAQNAAPYVSKRGLVITSAGLAAAGTAVKAAMAFPLGFDAWVLGVAEMTSCLFIGLSTSPLFIMGMELLSPCDMPKAGRTVSAAALLTIALSTLLSLAPFSFSAALIAAMPLAAGFTYMRNVEWQGGLPQSEYLERDGDDSGRTRLAAPIRPVLMMAAVEFAACFCTFPFVSQEISSTAMAFGVICVALVFLAGNSVTFLSDRFDIRMLYQISLPLMAAGLLAFPLLVHRGELVACALTNVGRFGFLLLTTIVLNENCRKNKIPSAWAFGFLRCAIFPAQLVGAWLVDQSSQVAPQDPFIWTLHSVALLAVVACSVAYLGNVNFLDSWRLASGGDEGRCEESFSLMARCAILARQHGLTHREEEVCLLVVQGKTVPQAAEELFISKETAKSHLKHAYAKLEIHSREELHELVASRMRDGQ